MKTNHFLIFLAFVVLSSCQAQNTIKENVLTAKDLKPFGRYLLNQQNALELISSAAHFGFSFEGTECRISAFIGDKNGRNYLQYELDDDYQKRIRIDGNSKEPLIIRAKTAGKHTVWIYKATEAHTGAIAITNISGRNVKPLQRPKAPVIEFIGNSITCGAAADPSEVPCGTGFYHDQHNAYMAYGPRVARALNTNFVLSSVSGIGIYRNWNSNSPIMPRVYEKLDFQENSQLNWDFSIRPDVVSIALGTNDLSRGDGKRPRLPFDSTAFVNNYVLFIAKVKSKYPDARIALLSSPMSGGSDRQLLQNCLSAIKKRIDTEQGGRFPVSLYFFQPMNARGCSGHPNVEDHAILAEQLIPFFRKLLS